MSFVKETIEKGIRLNMGLYGPPTVVTGTSPVTCSAVAFQVWEADTVIASITINGTAITDFNATQLPSGFTVFGDISSVTLSAGNGLAYNGNGNFGL